MSSAPNCPEPPLRSHCSDPHKGVRSRGAVRVGIARGWVASGAGVAGGRRGSPVGAGVPLWRGCSELPRAATPPRIVRALKGGTRGVARGLGGVKDGMEAHVGVGVTGGCGGASLCRGCSELPRAAAPIALFLCRGKGGRGGGTAPGLSLWGRGGRRGGSSAGSPWISIHRNVCVGPSAELPHPPRPPAPFCAPPQPHRPPPLKTRRGPRWGAAGPGAADPLPPPPPRNSDGAGKKNPLCVGSGVEARGVWLGLRIEDRIRASGTRLRAAPGSPSRVGPRPAWVTALLCSPRGSARSEVGWRRALKIIYISVVRGREARTTPSPRSPRAHPQPFLQWGPREARGWGGRGGLVGAAHTALCGVGGGGKWSGGEGGDGWVSGKSERGGCRVRLPGSGGGKGGSWGAYGGPWGGGGRCQWGTRRGWGTGTAVHRCAQNNGTGVHLGHGGALGGGSVRLPP